MMLTKRRVVVAKAETTEGTAETLTAAEGGILAIDPKMTPSIDIHERNPAIATLSKFGSIRGSQMAKLSFKVEIKGPGAAYSASVKPALGIYFRACGYAETIDTTPSSEKATYQPASTGVPSLTIGCYEDGVIKKIVGARGNVKISGKVGEAIFAEFEFTGVWTDAVDGAMLAPTYESTAPPAFLAASFSVAAYAAVIAGFDIDTANKIKLREDVNNAAGYISAIITDRKIVGSFDPEMVLVATHDWYGLWKAGTTGALNIGAIGTVQYNKFTITAPKLAYTEISDSEREGLTTADTNFELNMNTGDDELVIEFS